MKIAILGYSGQLGTECTTVLNYHDLGLFNSKNFNMNDFTVLDEYEYIINTVFKDKVDQAEVNCQSSIIINTDFVERLATYCSEKNKTLFHISTDYVFDGKLDYPGFYNEKDATNPINAYGITKDAGEKLALLRNKKTFIFRVSSLFGRKGNNFIESIRTRAKTGQQLRVVSDQWMSPTHAYDVALMIQDFIENLVDDYGIYHVCNSCDEPVSWYAFTREVLHLDPLFGHDLVQLKHISYANNPMIAARPKNSAMDNSKVKMYYNMPNWKDALRSYFKITGGK